MKPVEHPTRRQALRVLSAGSLTAWTAPQLLSMPKAAAACGSVGTLSTTGQVVVAQLSAGDNLRPNRDFESNTNYFVFAEQPCTTLTSALVTNDGSTIPSGTTVASYLVHFSPASGSHNVSGTITFPNTILGIDYETATLNGRDSTFGIAGVTYGGNRRTESNDTFSSSGATLNNLFRANTNFTDQMRVYVLV